MFTHPNVCIVRGLNPETLVAVAAFIITKPNRSESLEVSQELKKSCNFGELNKVALHQIYDSLLNLKKNGTFLI